jgi:alanine racemase
MINFSKLIEITAGEAVQIAKPELSIQHLLTDSRGGIQNRASLFFAIGGERHDGHQYINELYDRGVRQFVVEKLPSQPLPEANLLLVESSVKALQQIATFHRLQFRIPLIGITGSNGKTIVKEWLSQLLSTHENVARNPKSYNSQIGVPLALWNISASHTIGVFEAGISQVGEMERLAKILQPTYGIFTNIGSAHDRGFENREQKVSEKAQLFSTAQKIIYRKDYALIDKVLTSRFYSEMCVNWTTEPTTPSTYGVHWDLTGQSTEITVQHRETAQTFAFAVPFQDAASLENITHALVYGLSANYDLSGWQSVLSQLRPVSMRMEWKQGINQCYLVDDSYSNDLMSLQLALDFLKQQTQNDQYTVILSDVLQSGEKAPVLYQHVAKLLQQKGISRLIGIGPEIAGQAEIFKGYALTAEFYVNPQEFIEKFQPGSFSRENILVKGARTFHFEQIVQRLQQKIHSTVLEINLDAITHNLNAYRSRLSPTTKIMVMVKAFSYGGAAFEVANLLQFHQVDYLGVAYADEGVRLREHGIRTPILVLNPGPEAFEKMLEYRLEPEIYSLHLLSLFVDTLGDRTTELPIHIKLDSGMHRLGFSPVEVDQLAVRLEQHPLQIASVFSHLAASDEPQHDSFTEHQAQTYLAGYEKIASTLHQRPLRHILNSAGIIRFPQYQWDMVRLGIGLYGVESAGQFPQMLQPVGTLKTVISQIKSLKKGETVGYGRRGKIEKDQTIATIAIGYADGFDRGFGNGNGQVWVKGYLAPTVGSICMDMTMIDITGIDVSEGDEVIIFGSPISVESLAQQINTIPYEILTNIGERVKRVFYRES